MVEIGAALLALTVAAVIYWQRNSRKIPEGYQVGYSEFKGGFICQIFHSETLKTLAYGVGITRAAAYREAISKL